MSSQAQETWRTPRNLSALDLAFPASVRDMMPPYEEIPAEFRRWPGQTKWNRLISDWFYNGLSDLELLAKEGIDEKAALKTIRAIIGSFEPKHEHKEAAAAYLMSLWFEDADWKVAKAEAK